MINFYDPKRSISKLQLALCAGVCPRVFAYYLEGKGEKPVALHVLPSRAMSVDSRYDTAKDLKTYSEWPVGQRREVSLYLNRRKLSEKAPGGALKSRSYVSDPSNPIPYMDKLTDGRSKDYMAADQRFAEKRKDVLTYRGEPLLTDMLADAYVAELEKVLRCYPTQWYNYFEFWNETN